MTVVSLFPIAALLWTAHALPTEPKRDAQHPGTIKWMECEYPWETTVPVQCAKLAVPLDYMDLGKSERLELDLIKINATKEPYLGSMLFNPGGPGASGVDQVATKYGSNNLITNGQYDMIGFDPRGTGRTLRIHCSESNATASNSTRTSKRALTWDRPLNEVLGTKWNTDVAFAKNCANISEKTATAYGTMFVVRDMLNILDALPGDGQLRYYGISYGTILGWTFAQTFPARVDRMILDGNLNPHEYWNGYDVQALTSADGTFEQLINGCVASPKTCPLAAHGDANTIIKKFNAALEETYKTPPLLTMRDGTKSNITYNMAKDFVYATLYEMPNYPKVALVIQNLLEKDYLSMALNAGKLTTEQVTQVVSIDGKPVEPPKMPTTRDTANAGTNVSQPAAAASGKPEPWDAPGKLEELAAIQCSDWPLRATKPDDLKYLLAEQQNVSSFASTGYPQNWMCYSWPFRARERYYGDFNAETKHPVLFVNPTYDPITPLVSAFNSSSTLEGSIVLEHKGCGHGILSQPSLCTLRAMRWYMTRGVLPGRNTVCEPDIALFATNITFKDIMTSPKGAAYWSEDPPASNKTGALGGSKAVLRTAIVKENPSPEMREEVVEGLKKEKIPFLLKYFVGDEEF